ncbi:MAG: NAD(P)-dependent oxidoreductase [Rhodospirillaceae bacterium]|jgi:3-hydroxyisobutyrate dehydrogenase|nr:NAD(P)-dependent oxidoreductase [Rhodospirillaceae bacterium]MBT6116602.1 NAD(P)-dependent oxidoreductase [Rhodospirillaceae bacterium]
MRIGFVGIGNIGYPMARQLLRHGFAVQAYDRRQEAIGKIGGDGAGAARSVAEAAAGADALITSLPGPPEVEAVAGEILENLPEGATWIDMTTNDVHVVRALGEKTAARGLHMLEGTVSCGVKRAYEGKLTIFVGGEEDVFARHRAIFDAMAETVIRVGPLGDATVAKLITNMLAFVHQVAFAEGMMLGARSGLEIEPLWRAINASYGGSFVSENDGPRLFAGEFDSTFPLRLVCKDARLTAALANETGTPIPIATLAEQTYERARLHFGDEATCHSVMRLIEEATGQELRAEIDGEEA